MNATAANEFLKAARIDDSAKPGGQSQCQSIPLTTRAFLALHAVDSAFVGTGDYLGLAYFWSVEYKQELRAATPKLRKAVHDEFLKAGLALDGESPEHEAIVRRHTAKRCKQVYG